MKALNLAIILRAKIYAATRWRSTIRYDKMNHFMGHFRSNLEKNRLERAS